MESKIDYDWIDLTSEQVLRDIAEFAFARGALALVAPRLAKSKSRRELLVWIPEVGEIRMSISADALWDAASPRQLVLGELTTAIDQLRSMRRATPITLSEASQLQVLPEAEQTLPEEAPLQASYDLGPTAGPPPTRLLTPSFVPKDPKDV